MLKKIKLIVPILTAILLLLPGVQAEAATIEKQYTADVDSATLTLNLEKLQSFEGKISATAKEGGTITVKSVEVVGNDTNITSCGASRTRVFMVSNGTPVNTTITIKVAFSGPGTYWVTVRGGSTDKDGTYQSDSLDERIKITVSAQAGDGSGNGGTNDGGNHANGDSNTVIGTVTPSTDSSQSATEQPSDSGNKDTTKPSDSTTKPSDTKDTPEDSEEDTEEKGPIRVTIPDDEKAEQELLNQIIKDSEKNNKDHKNPSGLTQFIQNLRNRLKWILPLAIFLAAVAVLLPVMYVLFRKKRRSQVEYEGAPMVDYNIEEDDD